MNNKRKGRGGATGSNAGKSERAAPKHSKTPDKDVKELSPNESTEFPGLYNNARFTHALTSLIGVHLRVETINKDEFEGIFKTFSPNLDIVLELVHKVDPVNDDTVDLESVKEKMVFNLSSVVRYTAVDVDLEFAMKESFLTDSQIGANKMNGDAPLRDLEVWQPEDDGLGGGIEDDLKATHGWSAHDMFAKNEEQFGVKTSFDPSMAGYTVPLNKDRIDSEAEQRAARIAASIENEGRSRQQIELENGDEEEAFSAVTRPNDRRNGRERESPGDDKSSAYVPPGKRDGRGSFSRGRGQRTPPPSRYDNYDDREHRQRHDRGQNDRYGGGGGGARSGHREDRGGYGERPGDRGGGGGYHREDRSYGGGYSAPHKKDGGGEYRGGGGYNDQHRGGYDQRGGNPARPPSSHGPDRRSDDRKSAEKVSPLPPPEAEKGAERRRSGEANRSPDTEAAGGGGGLPQRDGRRKQDKSKEQSSSELLDFHQKFNLKISSDGSPPANPQHSPGTPTVSINPDLPSPHSTLPSPRDNKTPVPRPSPKPVTPTQTTPASSVPSASAADPSSASKSGGGSGGVKTSTLNPNAKEFTLNPTAKEFTPRTASMMAPRPSATPPRPQTPATPGGGGGGGGGQMAAPNMYTNIIPIQQGGGPQHMGGIQGTPFTPANQRPMRPNSKDGHMRPDLPSPMQVTGQPILAQQLHPPAYFPQAQMQYVHGPNGQPHIMRMVMPPGMMPSNLVPVPISSHGGHGGPMDNQQHYNQTSQYQTSPAPPQMWSPQVISAQSQMHPPTGPPQQGGVPPPHNSMAATPPAQGHTPAPSPGPQIIGYAGHQQPGLGGHHQYPMILMPSGGLPQFHQGMAGPPLGGPGGGPMVHQPVTSMASLPHYQYMQQGQPVQMMAQTQHLHQQQQ